MANRHNHYEVAFQQFLRQERIPYVAVNEQRRALSGNSSLKSVDFIVSPEPNALGVTCWLVDVKGRKFPSGNRQKQYWKNWATEDDLLSLTEWRGRFGDGFDAAIVFAYWLQANCSPTPPEQVFYYRDRPYAFIAIRLSDYAAYAQPLSKKWQTVSIPVATFRQLACPAEELFAATQLATSSW